VTSRLASLLVQEGIVSAKKMAEAFQRQVIYGGTLDTILLEMDIIDEPALIDALGRASNLPTAGDLPSAETLQAAGASRWFPHSVCERYRAVPISLDGNVLRVLVTDPPDRNQLDELGYLLSRSIDPIVALEHRFVQALAQVYGVEVPARFASLSARLRQRASSASPRPASGPAPGPLVVQMEAELPVATAPLPAVTQEPPAPAPARAVVTDIPLLPVAEPAAPMFEVSDSPTPRLTPRQLDSPRVGVVERKPR